MHVSCIILHDTQYCRIHDTYTIQYVFCSCIVHVSCVWHPYCIVYVLCKYTVWECTLRTINVCSNKLVSCTCRAKPTNVSCMYRAPIVHVSCSTLQEGVYQGNYENWHCQNAIISYKWPPLTPGEVINCIVHERCIYTVQWIHDTYTVRTGYKCLNHTVSCIILLCTYRAYTRYTTMK